MELIGRSGRLDSIAARELLLAQGQAASVTDLYAALLHEDAVVAGGGVFAERLPRVEDHLARYRQADLFLDTHPYNAHTTAADALLAGLPVLTIPVSLPSGLTTDLQIILPDANSAVVPWVLQAK